MVQKDLIIRKTVMHDARLRKLELTDRAWQIADQMRQDAAHMEQILTQNIPAEDLNVVFRCIDVMKQNLISAQGGTLHVENPVKKCP